jgi:hypothetical protein
MSGGGFAPSCPSTDHITQFFGPGFEGAMRVLRDPDAGNGSQESVYVDVATGTDG